MKCSAAWWAAFSAWALAWVAFFFFATGCEYHIGDEPCLHYGEAVQTRMADCGIKDKGHADWLQHLYDQCDGAMGITVVDVDSVNRCVERVQATSCEDIRMKGTPTCVDMVRL